MLHTHTEWRMSLEICKWNIQFSESLKTIIAACDIFVWVCFGMKMKMDMNMRGSYNHDPKQTLHPFFK